MVDNRLRPIDPVPNSVLESLGLGWYISEEAEYYLSDYLIQVSYDELTQYQKAARQLYEMYEAAARHVVEQKRYAELGIPENAIELIELSWQQRERNPMLYGRFDLAGAIDGHPVKLIEFNADTATILPETVTIQAEQLEDNKIPRDRQFNRLREDLARTLRHLRAQYNEKDPYLLVSTLGFEEDQLNAEVIAHAAEMAGFTVRHARLEEVIFSPEEGIFTQEAKEEYHEYCFWFKLIPWELIAYEEPELMEMLTEIARRELVTIINPAYTMLFQSKAIMKILWELFPEHELLLKTTDNASDFQGQAYVEKVIFGREGENVNIVDENGKSLESNDGDFGEYPSIYQQFVELPQDSKENRYQAGLYYTDQPSALSYRREDGYIIDDDAEFIGHYLS